MSTFSFGGPTTMTAATPSFGFGTNTFGAPATPAPAFGSPQAPAFGQPAATPTFGGTNAFGSTFGAPAASTFSAQPTAQPQQQPFGGTFGSAAPAAATSLFSFPTPAPTATAPSAFGTSQPTGSLFGTPAPAATQNQFYSFSPSAAAPPVSASAPWDSIFAAYNPSPQNTQCRFRAILYNVVDDPKLLPQLQQRPAQISEATWQQAMRNNPDPSTLVPVQATGFKDLQLRLHEQDKMITILKQRFQEIEEKLRSLKQKHDLDLTVRISEYRDRHSQLAHRLLKVMRHLSVLQAAGTPLLPEEEGFWAKMDQIQHELDKPSEFRGRLQKLSTAVDLLGSSHDRQAAVLYAKADTIDEENQIKIYKYLEGQQGAIKSLVQEIQTQEDTMNNLSQIMYSKT